MKAKQGHDRMKRCSHKGCRNKSTFSVEGSNTAIYWAQHAEDGMMNVHSRRCPHVFFQKHPSVNFKGSKQALYCKQHAENCMVDVISRRCSHKSCNKWPTFGTEGRKTATHSKQHAEDDMLNARALRAWTLQNAAGFQRCGSKKGMYCMQHADHGMVNVVRGRCFHGSCTGVPSFNLEGSKTWVYCKQNAEDDMVGVIYKRCSHDSCNNLPTSNDVGSKRAVYCKWHAEDGMVNVRIKCCSHSLCNKEPVWGLLTDGAATACTRHKIHLSGGLILNFRTKYKIAGCRRFSRWGLIGNPPTHCPDHALLEDGLVCTVRAARIKLNSPNPSCRAVKGPSFHVEAECRY